MATQEGTRIVTALESTWGAIQKHHPDVPDVVIVTGTGQRGRGRLTWGHHTADRWLDAAAAGRKAELFVSGEAVAKGGEMVVETMLHEAAHALAAARNIRDTSCAGRWHNREYAALAREVGLEPPKRAAKVIGFSESLITAATVGRYASQIRRLNAATLARIEVPRTTRASPASSTRSSRTRTTRARAVDEDGQASAWPSSAAAPRRPAECRSPPHSWKRHPCCAGSADRSSNPRRRRWN